MIYHVISGSHHLKRARPTVIGNSSEISKHARKLHVSSMKAGKLPNLKARTSSQAGLRAWGSTALEFQPPATPDFPSPPSCAHALATRGGNGGAPNSGPGAHQKGAERASLIATPPKGPTGPGGRREAARRQSAPPEIPATAPNGDVTPLKPNELYQYITPPANQSKVNFGQKSGFSHSSQGAGMARLQRGRPWLAGGARLLDSRGRTAGARGGRP